MTDLTTLTCKPCKGSTAPMDQDGIEEHLAKLDGWKVIDYHHLIKEYKFKNFKDALDLVNRIGAIAEQEDHHPDITFGWSYVQVKLYTHNIKGLSLNDFICAAKFDKA